MSNEINDGGPAYPATLWASAGTGPQDVVRVMHPGMTLRDYFAATASEEDIQDFMPATVGAADMLEEQDGIKRTRRWARYQHADAMLAERAKRRESR